MKALVTGCNGFIGQQLLLKLKQNNVMTIGVDVRSNDPTIERIQPDVYVFDSYESDKSLTIIDELRPNLIFHMAASSLVGPSYESPDYYYWNNVTRGLKLLDFITGNGIKSKIIFASSASVYGNCASGICNENTPKDPISPYGVTKNVMEYILRDYYNAYGLSYLCFRLFNVCGADKQKLTGPDKDDSHLIATLIDKISQRETIKINGNNCNTKDGTCVRDYIHVDDVCKLLVKAGKNYSNTVGYYNVGTGVGYSNNEILDLVFMHMKNSKRSEVVYGPKRAGDPDTLIADVTKTKSTFDWEPTQTIVDCIVDNVSWYNCKNKYR